MATKHCNKCDTTKSIEEFPFDKYHGRRYAQCKPCRNKYKANCEARYKEKHGKTRMQVAYKNPLIRARQLLASYKRTDAIKGYDGEYYTEEQLVRLFDEWDCVYCGDSDKLGLDRIDNTKGHTVDNIVTACEDCNKARNNSFTHEETFILGEAIRMIKEKRGKV